MFIIMAFSSSEMPNFCHEEILYWQYSAVTKTTINLEGILIDFTLVCFYFSFCNS